MSNHDEAAKETAMISKYNRKLIGKTDFRLL